MIFKRKIMSWHNLVLIYCLINGDKEISEDDIAKSFNISLEEYKSILSFLKNSGIYNLIGKYVNYINTIPAC